MKSLQELTLASVMWLVGSLSWNGGHDTLWSLLPLSSEVLVELLCQWGMAAVGSLFGIVVLIGEPLELSASSMNNDYNTAGEFQILHWRQKDLTSDICVGCFRGSYAYASSLYIA